VIGIVGLLARDVVDGGPPRIGGAVWYCARTLAALGRPAVVVTKYASFDQRLAAPLHGLGLRVEWRPSPSTISFEHRNRGDERESSIGVLGEGFDPEEARGWVADALTGVEWVHAGGLSRGDFSAEALAELARGRSLSLDGQTLVRPSRTGPVAADGDFDPAVLDHVRMLKLSREEAAVLAVDEVDVPELVVTLGAEGCLVRADGQEERIAAARVAIPDPTGAGDTFAAAYVAARTTGKDPFAAAEAATAVVPGILTGWRTGS
jgi:sugar/nucleoside kinase (ribokinase family)